MSQSVLIVLLSIWVAICFLSISYCILMIGYAKFCIPFLEEISFDNLDLSDDGD